MDYSHSDPLRENLIELEDFNEDRPLLPSSECEAPASISPASISPASIPIHQGEEQSQVPEGAANTDAEVFEDFVNYFRVLSKQPKTIKILYKVLKNIADNPEQDKFKKLKHSNKIIQENILKVQESVELLYMIGFTQEVIEDERVLYYNPVSQEMPSPFIVTKWMELMGLDIEGGTQTPGGPKEEKKKEADKPPGKLARLYFERIERQKYMPKRKPLSAHDQIHEYRQKAKEKEIRTRKSKTITVNDIENMRKQELLANPSPLIKLGLRTLELTNKFRKSHGLPELKWSQPLHDIAMEHSFNMHEKKVPISHQGFNKRCAKIPFIHRGAAQNVAYNMNCGDPCQVAVNGWIQSPGHCRNLLGNFVVCGIAVFAGKNGYYFTQFFAN